MQATHPGLGVIIWWALSVSWRSALHWHCHTCTMLYAGWERKWGKVLLHPGYMHTVLRRKKPWLAMCSRVGDWSTQLHFTLSFCSPPCNLGTEFYLAFFFLIGLLSIFLSDLAALYITSFPLKIPNLFLFPLHVTQYHALTHPSACVGWKRWVPTLFSSNQLHLCFIAGLLAAPITVWHVQTFLQGTK